VTPSGARDTGQKDAPAGHTGGFFVASLSTLSGNLFGQILETGKPFFKRGDGFLKIVPARCQPGRTIFHARRGPGAEQPHPEGKLFLVGTTWRRHRSRTVRGRSTRFAWW
jgi:hypothetical protein